MRTARSSPNGGSYPPWTEIPTPKKDNGTWDWDTEIPEGTWDQVARQEVTYTETSPPCG